MKIKLPTEINKTIKEIIDTFELLMPNKMISFYIIGSYAENYYTKNSDIDALLILKDNLSKKELNKAENILDNLSEESLTDLDISVISENELYHPKTLNQKIDALLVKKNSYLFYGKEIKEKIPEIDIDSYINMAVNRPIHFIARVRDNKYLTYPIDYPNKEVFHFGYCNRKILINGKNTPSTKELVVNVGWMATALIALKAKEVVVRKNDCLDKYKLFVNDEWVDFLEDVFAICRDKWEYRIPQKNNDKNKLISICKKTLQFENYFLEEYKNFIISQLKKKDHNNHVITEILSKKIHYAEPEILEILNKNK